MSLHQVAVALDQLANTLLGGWADETVSARAWRNRAQRKWAAALRVIDAIFFWDHDHCRHAYEWERARMGMPVEYRR